MSEPRRGGRNGSLFRKKPTDPSSGGNIPLNDRWGRRSMRILIADDSEHVRHGVRKILSSQGHWEICGEAKDGVEAIQLAVDLHPDVILLDISMPGMSGL